MSHTGDTKVASALPRIVRSGSTQAALDRGMGFILAVFAILLPMGAW